MEIGFIGLGKMGHPMVGRLIAAGHSLTVCDTDQAALARAAALGAQTAATPAELADRVETIMASLPSLDAVLAVATEISRGKRVRRFVDLSTTGSRMAIRIHAMLAERNIVQIDSPVSGGVGGAQKGTLAVMVSGPAADVATVAPALAVLGRVFNIGEQPGAGQVMKLCNNILTATALAATSEAMVMGVKAGLDPSIMLDVINSGSGRNTASQDKFPRAILPGTFDFGFASGLMMKDVKLFLEEARGLDLPIETAEAVGRVWQQTIDEVGPDKDFTTVIQPIERRAGVTVRTPRED